MVTMVKPVLVSLAASGATTRLPSRTSAPSKTWSLDRKNFVVVPPPGTAPRFFVESLIVILDPAVAALKPETETVRSGSVTLIDLLLMLASLVSSTSCSASATTRMKYEPGVVPGGIVTVVDPALACFAANGGTERLPRKVSPPSSLSLERKNSVIDASAGTDSLFLVSSETFIVAPGATLDGLAVIFAVRLASVTLVLSEVVLLPKLVSGWLAETAALLVKDPVIVGVTTIVIVAPAPFARAPRLQVTVVVPLQVPRLGTAETKLTLAGSASTKVTSVAISGPRFVAVNS